MSRASRERDRVARQNAGVPAAEPVTNVKSEAPEQQSVSFPAQTPIVEKAPFDCLFDYIGVDLGVGPATIGANVDAQCAKGWELVQAVWSANTVVGIFRRLRGQP